MAWNFANAGGGFLIQIVRGIILARLLVPEEFGVVGMAMGTCALSGIFTNLGMGGALVQTRSLERHCSNSAFWFQTLVTFAIAVLLAAASPWVASFYGDARLTPIVCVLSAGMLINGSLTVPLALMQRDLRFKEINVMWGVLRLASFATAVTMAATGWSYWSLIVPDIATRLFALPTLLWRQKWLPRFGVNLGSLRPIMSFSAKSFFSQCLATINTNIDYVILGRFFAPEIFGLYFFGYRRVRGPLKVGTMSVRAALFPALSRVQDSAESARRAFFQGMPVLAAILYPLATLGILVAPQLVPLVFGEEWTPAAPLLQMFLVWTYFIPINLLVTANFQSRGIFAPTLLDSSARAILLTVGLVFLGAGGYSIYWCGFWVILVEMFGNTFVAAWGLQHMEIRFRQVLRTMAGPLAAGLAVAAFDLLWWPLAPGAEGFASWGILLARLIQGVGVGFLVTYCVDRHLVHTMFQQLAELVRSR